MFATRGGFYKTFGFGNSLLFNGDPPVIDPQTLVYTTSNTDLINWMNTGGFTIEYWCYMLDWPSTLDISPGPGNQAGGGANYWTFGPSDNGALQFYYWTGSQNRISTVTGALSLNTWHNISFVCTQTGPGTNIVSMYIDGVAQNIRLNGTGSYVSSINVPDGIISTSTDFSMGKYSGSYYVGYMDNLRVSNTQRYTGASYTLATSPFTVDSYTQLLITPTGNPGTSTIPYTTNSSTGTMNNSFNLVTISGNHFNHS